MLQVGRARYYEPPAQDGDLCPSGRFKRNFALFFSLTLLFIPLLIFKYIDYVSKSRVYENTSEEGSLLNRLSIANESLGGGTVIVMAERDKEEIEPDIAKIKFDFKGTSVICRSGSPP